MNYKAEAVLPLLTTHLTTVVQAGRIVSPGIHLNPQNFQYRKAHQAYER